MNWTGFLNAFAGRPLFHTSMLSIFKDPPHHRQVQLARWTKAGKLSQIRRGWYLIEKPWRMKEVPIAFIANNVVHPSYLSLEWALQYYEIIPEYVPNPTSVTTERAIRFSAQNALFIYHHVQPSFFKGYRQVKQNGWTINIASPEKALLDKIYLFLKKSPFSIEWLQELRLQNLEDFDIERFESYVSEEWRKKFRRVLEQILNYLRYLKGESD